MMVNGMLGRSRGHHRPVRLRPALGGCGHRHHRRRRSCVAAVFIERRGIDDPVGAIAVHGVCGTFGVLAVGIFANGQYGAGWNGTTTTTDGRHRHPLRRRRARAAHGPGSSASS